MRRWASILLALALAAPANAGRQRDRMVILPVTCTVAELDIEGDGWPIHISLPTGARYELVHRGAVIATRDCTDLPTLSRRERSAVVVQAGTPCGRVTGFSGCTPATP
jgi:hypothetical protein